MLQTIMFLFTEKGRCALLVVLHPKPAAEGQRRSYSGVEYIVLIRRNVNN